MEHQDDSRRPERSSGQNAYERLRSLPWADQQKIAREGDLTERIAVERLCGKAVWEFLLTNPRIGVAEVARMACKGALPKPLIEQIVANGSWLANAQVRRGLLTNPRLGREQIARVLRAMPKHELKLAPKQSIYPTTVRETARKLLGKPR